MTLSFLAGHFITWMDAYKDGRIKNMCTDGITFDVSRARSDEQATAVYCVINDLDCDEWVPRLLKQYRELRAVEPPPIPSNIVLGTN